MTAFRVAVCVVLLPLVAACVLPDEVSQLQKDMADVRQQLRNVAERQSEMDNRLGEFAASRGDDAQGPSREDLAAVELRLDQLDRQLSVTTERMNDVDQRLDRYSQDLQQTRELVRRGGGGVLPPLAADSPSPTAADESPATRPATEAFPDPEALYNTAYADFSKGNYALAVAGFGEYQERFPDSALADNALYWIAECRFSEGDYPATVEALDDLLGRYPDSDKAPAANLKKALAFQEQNQIGQAIIQYRYVVSAYPATDESRLARDKLAALGAAPN